MLYNNNYIFNELFNCDKNTLFYHNYYHNNYNNL